MEQHFIERRVLCRSCGGSGQGTRGVVVGERSDGSQAWWYESCYPCGGQGYRVTRTPLPPLIGQG